MDLGLQGKRAWVLGGSSGLGGAIAKSLASEGAVVAISSRSRSRLEESADEIHRDTGAEVVVESVDVTHVEEIFDGAARVVSRLGGLDILVSNQGGPPSGTFVSADEEAFQAAFNLVLRSAFCATKAVIPTMVAGGGGTVVYVTSSSVKQIIPNLFLSNVMRIGVQGMAKSLARELAHDGIRVLCAAPGRIQTDRVMSIDRANADRQGRDVLAVRQESEATIPMARYGTSTEFGDVVAFLCSPRASYMTGTTVLIDGGRVSAMGG